MAYSALDTSIRVAFEEQGATPEDIAGELGIDLATVKYSLANNSPIYRKHLRTTQQNPEIADSQPLRAEDVTEDESSELLAVMKNLALSADDEGIRFKAAQFLFNERKGRNNVTNGPIGGGIPLSQLNALLDKAVRGANAIADATPVIDITPIP